MSIGDHIRDLRWEHRLNQGELARRAGVAQNTLSRIELGETTPSVPTLEKIAKALEVPLEELVKETVPLGDALQEEAGPSLLEKALNAARQDEEKNLRAMARESASEGLAAEVHSGYAEDKIRAELRRRGYPDEDFDNFIWPLVVAAARVEPLEQALAACEEERRELAHER